MFWPQALSMLTDCLASGNKYCSMLTQYLIFHQATTKVLGIQNQRVTQCRVAKITLLGPDKLAMQVDGEAWLQETGTIVVSHKNKARMIFKDKVSFHLRLVLLADFFISLPFISESIFMHTHTHARTHTHTHTHTHTLAHIHTLLHTHTHTHTGVLPKSRTMETEEYSPGQLFQPDTSCHFYCTHSSD